MATKEKQSNIPRELETYELLRGDYGKAQFLAGEIENPHTPPLVEHAEKILTQSTWTQEDVDNLWSATGLSGEAKFSGSAYRLALVNYLRTLSTMQKLRMLRSTQYGVDKAQWLETIKRVNESGSELYGDIDPSEFSKLFSRYASIAFQPTDIPELRQIQLELASMANVPETPIDEENQSLLEQYTSEEQFKKISDFVNKDYEKHFEGIEDKQKYTPEEICEIFRKAVLEEGTAFDGVGVELVDASNISANSRRRVFEVGQNLKPQTGNWVKGMIAHEFWHMRRSLLAPDDSEESRHGQDTYLTFDEGVGPALEDAARGKMYAHGERHYLAAGFIKGVDGGGERDFRGAFEVLWRLELLNDCLSRKKLDATDIAGIIETKKSQAFDGVIRIKRGTGFDIPGTIHASALNYKNGQKLGWDYLNTIDSYEDYLAMYYTGKYDLLDTRHTEYRQTRAA